MTEQQIQAGIDEGYRQTVAELRAGKALPVVAIDVENGEAYGPFDTHEAADVAVGRFMVELGEWRLHEPTTPFQLALEHFFGEAEAREGHFDADGCREQLCSAVDLAGWMVNSLAPLEAGEGLLDDIHEERGPSDEGSVGPGPGGEA